MMKGMRRTQEIECEKKGMGKKETERKGDKNKKMQAKPKQQAWTILCELIISYKAQLHVVGEYWRLIISFCVLQAP